MVDIRAKNWPEVLAYAEAGAGSDSPEGEDVRAACQRFLNDLEDERWYMDAELPEFLILTIESTFAHKKAEALDGTPMSGAPLILQSWQKFVIYNLGFYMAGTKIRRFQEMFLMLARKNGKTPFATALIWALGLWSSPSGTTIKVVSGSTKMGKEASEFLGYNLHRLKLTQKEDRRHGLREYDSSLGQRYHGPIWNGSIDYELLAYNPDGFEAFNGNLVHLDELELYRNSEPYTKLRKSMIAYSNRLLLCTTTAGDDGTGFCAQHTAYCSRVVRGEITSQDADRIFAFIARAPQNERGEVDYLNPAVQRMANPSWNVTIRPEEIMGEALMAKNEPTTMKDFLSRRLNVFTSSLRAWFDLNDLRASDRQYSWTMDELVKLPIKWYGGADLARRHDLTAGAIVGEYNDVLIVIAHAWFPVIAAAEKADRDQIPLFGWKDDGWLDMSNDRSTNLAEIVKWFSELRANGFNIAKVGHDRKFSPEYVQLMKHARFRIVDQPQLHHLKSQGFRHIEQKILTGKLYYLHSELFEYAVGNVYGVEKEDDVVVYEKISDTLRIDPFDAAVFATTRMLIDSGKGADFARWTEKEKK